MRIRMFFRMVFDRSIVREVEAIFCELTTLAEQIKPLLTSDDRLRALVQFFNLTSPWQDRGGLTAITNRLQEVNWNGQHDETIAKFQELNRLFRECGRSSSGWNRTNPGDEVTEDTVFLGNVCGLFTKTISFWRAQTTPIPYEFCRSMGLTEEYTKKKPSDRDVVIDLQARPFVRKNGQAIIDAITKAKLSAAA